MALVTADGGIDGAARRLSDRTFRGHGFTLRPELARDHGFVSGAKGLGESWRPRLDSLVLSFVVNFFFQSFCPENDR